MCTYCNLGDWSFRHDPPWHVPPSVPYIPQPIMPGFGDPWGIKKLQEYYDLLKEVKEMEDKIGCPCEPNKADYIKLFEERIKKLKRKKRKRKQE